MLTLDRVARLPPALILLLLLVGAVGLGGIATQDPRLGIAAAGGLVFAAFLVVDLPVAVGLWIVALYLAGAPGTSGAVTGSSVVLLAGWAGTFGDRAHHLRPALRRARWPLLATAAMLLWSALSYAWAPDAGAAKETIFQWVVAVAVLPVLVTACVSPRDVTVVAAWFVVGATVAIVVGVLTGSNAAPESQAAALEGSAGRLSVGITDPNYLAVDIVAALAIIAGLLGLPRLRAWRPALLLAVPILLYGLIATQSRGGIIAVAAMAVVGWIVFRPYRARIAGAVVVAVVLLGLFLALQPRASDRLTQDDTSGTGRTDIWRVALKAYADHPVLGTGTGNWVVVEPSYALDVGFISTPSLIVDDPLVTHDVWLQALVENGPLGLALLIATFGACIAASFAAARRFRAAGRHDLAHLASAVAVGQLGALAGSTFIANGNDRVWWVLLALGPALLAVAPPRSPGGAPSAVRAEGRPARG